MGFFNERIISYFLLLKNNSSVFFGAKARSLLIINSHGLKAVVSNKCWQ